MGTTSLKTRKSSSETRKRRDTPNVELLLPDFTQISESEKYEEWSVANTMVPHSGSFPGLRTYSPPGALNCQSSILSGNFPCLRYPQYHHLGKPDPIAG